MKYAAAAGASLLLPSCRPAPTDDAKPSPHNRFGDGALRLDLRHRLNEAADAFELVRVRAEPLWPGRRKRLDEALDWGDYRLSVYDAPGGALLFRAGFDSSVDPSVRATAAELSLRLPAPRHTLHVAIEKRRPGGVFQDVWHIALEPESSAVDRSPVALATRVDAILSNGPPESKVDLAILGDGYRSIEYPKFIADAKRAAGYLFSVDPLARRIGDFNVHSVFTPSAESGATDRYLGLHRDTVFGCTYYEGEAERTAAVRNVHVLREAASVTPYDFLLVLLNARRYGGSAHFGGPAVVAIDSDAANYLVIHELAHVIGGVADEYYIPTRDGPVYSGNVEPWNPNVTISPQKGKWSQPASAGGNQPAIWNKAEYDRYFSDYVKRYFRLRAVRADEAVIDKFMRAERTRQAVLLGKNPELRRVGLFEGANGYARGVFRSEVNCIMFSLQTEYFCKACASAIERGLDAHC